jgi:hypothetical protein
MKDINIISECLSVNYSAISFNMSTHYVDEPTLIEPSIIHCLSVMFDNCCILIDNPWLILIVL